MSKDMRLFNKLGCGCGTTNEIKRRVLPKHGKTSKPWLQKKTATINASGLGVNTVLENEFRPSTVMFCVIKKLSNRYM